MTTTLSDSEIAKKVAGIDEYFALAGYRPDETIGICWNPEPGSTDLHFAFTQVCCAAEEILKHPDTNCWMNAAVLATVPTKGRGKKPHMGRLPSLYADLDLKGFSKLPPGEAIDDTEAMAKLLAVIDKLSTLLGEKPTVILYTVGGMQPRWTVDGDVDGDTLLRFGKLVKAVAEEHGGTADSVFDKPRLLRAPGSTNSGFKNGKRVYPKPRPTKITACDDGEDINLDRLIETLDARGIRVKREDERPPAPTTALAPGRGNKYTERAVKGVVDDLKASRAWPEGYEDMKTGTGRGWEKYQADAAYRLASLALASWNDLTMEQAQKAFLAAAPTGDGWTFDMVAQKWDYQSGYAVAADKPKDLEEVVIVGDSFDGIISNAFTGASGEQAGAPPGTPEPQPQPGPAPAETAQLWERPVMRHLHDFARARGVGPYAVLGAALARVIAMTSVRYVLPPFVGGLGTLNACVALVGPSGLGKDAANAAAEEALDLTWADPISGEQHLPTPELGSGEGVVHQYARYNKAEGHQRTRESVLFTCSEVDSIAALGSRQGSTLLSTVRSAWSGSGLGFAYADPSKALPVTRHSYRFTLVVGVQPERAGGLLDDAAGGTPQRFLWVPTTDPDAPRKRPPAPLPRAVPLPQVPGRQTVIRVCLEAEDDVVNARTDALHGVAADSLDGHALYTREKIAAGLAILDGHLAGQGITTEDWYLSGLLMQISDATRTYVKGEISRRAQESNVARGRSEAEREVVKTEVVHSAVLQKASRTVMNALGKKPGEWMCRGDLSRTLGSEYRKVLNETLLILEAAGQIEHHEDEFKGNQRHMYRTVS